MNQIEVRLVHNDEEKLSLWSYSFQCGRNLKEISQCATRQNSVTKNTLCSAIGLKTSRHALVLLVIAMLVNSWISTGIWTRKAEHILIKIPGEMCWLTRIAINNLDVSFFWGKMITNDHVFFITAERHDWLCNVHHITCIEDINMLRFKSFIFTCCVNMLRFKSFIFTCCVWIGAWRRGFLITQPADKRCALLCRVRHSGRQVHASVNKLNRWDYMLKRCDSGNDALFPGLYVTDLGEGLDSVTLSGPQNSWNFQMWFVEALQKGLV